MKSKDLKIKRALAHQKMIDAQPKRKEFKMTPELEKLFANEARSFREWLDLQDKASKAFWKIIKKDE